MPGADVLIDLAARFTLVVLLLSMALAFARLVKGPSAADRIAALDLLSILIVAFVAVYSIHRGETSFLDVAIAYALIAFLGTVALSRYLMRSVQKEPPDVDGKTVKSDD